MSRALREEDVTLLPGKEVRKKDKAGRIHRIILSQLDDAWDDASEEEIMDYMASEHGPKWVSGVASGQITMDRSKRKIVFNIEHDHGQPGTPGTD